MKPTSICFKKLSKVFRFTESGEIERLLKKSGRWRVVRNVANSKGYCRVGFNKSLILYHRLKWCLFHKVDLEGSEVIDHINGNKLDNSIENLRLVSNRENTQNRQIHRNGSLPGCYFDKYTDRWKSQIAPNGTSDVINIGRYSSEEEANTAYNIALKHIDFFDTRENNSENRKIFRKIVLKFPRKVPLSKK